MQGEQHVGVPSHFLIRTGSAGAACGDGCIEEEGGFLSCWGTQLTLILKLPGEEGRENSVGVSKRGHKGLEKEDRC